MIHYLLRRIFFIIVSLFVASIIVFMVTQLLPGDVAQMILGQFSTPEALDELRRTLGLYDPFHIRYLDWMSGILRGELGISLSIEGIGIADLLLQRARNSLFLAGCASIFLIPISLFIGTIAGLKRDTWVDKFISLVTITAISVPEFASGIFLILLFSLTLNFLPSASNIDPTGSLFKHLPHLILPILTLSLVFLGYIARMMRASVIEVSSSNYVRTAVLKGLSDAQVIWKHVVRNALLPSVTVIAMNIGFFIGGLIVVETVFAYPGLGSLLLFAINQRDVPLIQATVLFVFAAYMLLNLVADLLYMFLNPRIRYT